MQDFERTRVELTGGQSVTITSWYDDEKCHWRGNAPALLHLLPDATGGENALLTGATRDKAILAVRGALAHRLPASAAR